MIRNNYFKSFVYLVLVVSMVSLAGCERREKQPEVKEQQQVMKGTIVVMGDSLTAGLGVSLEESLPYLLEQQLHSTGQNYRVVNAGISGETSRGALSRLVWVLTMMPDIVVLETGANDGLRGLPPSHVKQNLLLIIKELKEKKVVTVLAGMKMVSNRGASYTKEFEAVYTEVARETGVIYIPFFLKGVAGQPEFNRDDGIHPNAKGYQIILKTIYPYILQAIEKNEEDRSYSPFSF